MPVVRKAVVTAAGQGTRQFPATHTIQKELIPLVDMDGYSKPTLQVIMEDALQSGIEEFCVIANPANAGPIRAHFTGISEEQRAGSFRGKDWALTLSDTLHDIGNRMTIVVQESPQGYGHAVYQAREWAGDEPFVLIVGDHVNISDTDTPCPRQIVDIYDRFQSPVSSVARIPAPNMSRYGVCAGRPFEGATNPSYYMTAMQEKPSLADARARLVTPGLPEDTFLCFYGLHVFPSAVFDCLHYLIEHDIRERGEIQMATAQQMLFESGPYIVSELAGKQLDMGTPDGLIMTQLTLALNSPYRELVLSLLASQN